jgi:hypothetical protein
MKHLYLLLLTLPFVCLPMQAQPFQQQSYYDEYEPEYRHPGPEPTIQIALLLDVSGSMDGLLEQAKSQLWFIVNGIMRQYPGRSPRLEMALYEYGRESLGYREGYARQLVPFTSDLDWLAEELYGMYTGGSKEYCGLVIDRAVRELVWQYGPADQRMIFIAGNESFGQGQISYRSAVQEAVQQGIQVNSLYCGTYQNGVRHGWREAAEIGMGTYALIDQQADQHRSLTQASPQWLRLNTQLNQTYVPYGSQGSQAWQRQQSQDRQASQFGQAYAQARTETKASPAYRNPDWDLVDAVSSGRVQLARIPSHELPAEMRGMALPQQQRYIAQKHAQRQQLQQEIAQLSKQEAVKEAQASTQTSSTRPAQAKPQRLDDAVVQASRKPVKPVSADLVRGQVAQPPVPARQAAPARTSVSTYQAVTPAKPVVRTSPAVRQQPAPPKAAPVRQSPLVQKQAVPLNKPSASVSTPVSVEKTPAAGVSRPQLRPASSPARVATPRSIPARKMPTTPTRIRR